ncbi:MAG: hypothetical protein GY894_03640 [Planctomycetes bacterium]|nr:hypothetical protein [Planctomycetota bacterium]
MLSSDIQAEMSGEVDINDVLVVLGNYLCGDPCVGDTNDDGIVDINDVLQVLGLRRL